MGFHKNTNCYHKIFGIESDNLIFFSVLWKAIERIIEFNLNSTGRTIQSFPYHPNWIEWEQKRYPSRSATYKGKGSTQSVQATSRNKATPKTHPNTLCLCANKSYLHKSNGRADKSKRGCGSSIFFNVDINQQQHQHLWSATEAQQLLWNSSHPWSQLHQQQVFFKKWILSWLAEP